MYVEFYKFSKKLNSTAQPDLDPEQGLPFWGNHMTLKDGCSVLNPVLKIANSAKFKPYEYNYAFIREFGKRYYFVNDYKFVNNMWECYLTVDVLATYRDSILDSEQYVARAKLAASKVPSVVDSMPLTLTETVKIAKSSSAIYEAGYTSGFIVVGLVAPDAGMGSTDYYLFTSLSNFKTFTSKIMSNTAIYSAEDVSDELMKLLVNPYQYITSCRFFPFNEAGITCDTKNIKLGFWDLGINGNRLTSYTINKSLTIDVPKHPQKSELGSFLDNSPYSSYTLEFEPFGSVSLDSSCLANIESMTLDVLIDLITGEARLKVKNPEGHVITTCYGKVCVDLPIVDMNTAGSSTIANSATNILNSAASGWAKIGDSGLASTFNTLAGVSNVFAEAGRGVNIRGSQNTRAFLSGTPMLFGTFQKMSTTHVEKFGRAVCKICTLADLGGYVKCVNPVLNITECLETEYKEIISFLEGGFYVE